MLKNIGSNWALNAVQILVFLVLARFVLVTLGIESTGVWSAIVAFVGPLQLLVLGIPMASVRFVSGHVARGDVEAANRTLATCTVVALAMGAAALLVAVPLYVGFDGGLLTSDAWSLSAAQAGDARRAFAILAVSVAVGFALRLPYGIFDAHHDFVARNSIMASGFALKLCLTVLMLSIRADLTTLAAVQLVVSVTEFGVATVVSRARHGGVRMTLADFDRSLIRSMLTFSLFAMLLNVGALLAFRLDAIVVGARLDETSVAIYEYGNKIFEPFLGLVLGIGMVVMPLATSLRATGREADLGEVLLKWTRVASTLVFLVGLYLLIAGPAFLRWWLGPEYHPQMGTLMRVLMASFLVFLPVRGVALPMLMGTGREARPAIALVVMGALNVALSVAWIGPLGLMGVALGTALPNVLFAGYVLHVACHELGLRVRELIGRAYLRPLIGAGLPAALLLLVETHYGIDGFWQLLGSGLAYTALFVVAQLGLVFRGDHGIGDLARFGRRTPTGEAA